MIRYYAASGGLHVLGVLLLMLALAPSAKQAQATYTIDFIGSGKVQAVQAPADKPAKTEVAAPKPAQTAVPKEEAPKPAKKAYVAKQEISDKPKPTKPKTAVEEPLAAPSILEDGDDDDKPAAGSSEKLDFEGGNIQTDFANFPYPWYITQVRNAMWIEWEKRRPAGNTLSALVTFAIARDGKIKDLKVSRKSGDDSFDFAASSSIINAGPFAPLPMYYEKDELTVTVEFKQEK